MPIKLPQIPPCRDPFDEPYLALVGKAAYLVTGDRDLLSLRDMFECSIVTASDFLALF